MAYSDLGYARTVDGTGNATDDAGAAGDTLLRLTDPDYSDGIGAMSGDDRPGARAVSNGVMQQSGDMPAASGASDYLWAWGQFLDHDLSLTEAGHTETANIAVPTGDVFFDPMGTGAVEIRFSRVDAVEGTGEDSPRQYENAITSFIDASQIYGSSQATIDMMRVDGGKLRMVDDMLDTTETGFMTGDIRAAENVALSSLHTLFTREHNSQVDRLLAEDPTLNDDELFLLGRVHVEAIMQAVTFNEFLPKLLGDDAIGAYAGYDASVDPGISVEFSTAVYRFGHSLLSGTVQRLNEDGTVHDSGNLALRDAFFNPTALFESGIDPILRGLGQGQSQELDTFVIEDVRSFLFGPPGAGGFDLAALNIQRGRDMGIGSYNELRMGLGLAAVTSFDQITSDADLSAKLESTYGSVDLVDAWVGGLAEDAVNGGLLGETFSTVMIDQFSRVRDGDAYWSQNLELTPAELDAIWSTTLADVIVRNTDVDHIQADVFTAYSRIGGTDGHDNIGGTESNDLMIGEDGRDIMRGGKSDDELFGGNQADRLFGQKGDDRLHGENGSDRLYGGKGDDALFGGAGRDMLKGGRGDDTLDGGAARDKLFGGRGDDTLDGGAGRDHLRGGHGDDVLSGGAGHDSFDFRGWNTGNDTVTDFEIGDRLDFGHGRTTVSYDADTNTATVTHGRGSSVVFEDIDEAHLAEIMHQADAYHC